MSGNAPEELRERVDELEATVRGLTQELVEANERIRRLEEETGAAGGTRQGYGGEDEEGADKPMPAEDGGTDERDAADGDDGEDDDGVEDDIIVA